MIFGEYLKEIPLSPPQRYVSIKLFIPLAEDGCKKNARGMFAEATKHLCDSFLDNLDVFMRKHQGKMERYYEFVCP